MVRNCVLVACFVAANAAKVPHVGIDTGLASVNALPLRVWAEMFTRMMFHSVSSAAIKCFAAVSEIDGCLVAVCVDRDSLGDAFRFLDFNECHTHVRFFNGPLDQGNESDNSKCGRQ